MRIGQTPEKKHSSGKNNIILVTNDDGIHSPGIRTIAGQLSRMCETWIIAPDRERSAVGHSFTMNHPIRANVIEPRVVITDGTPTDCVMFGALGYLEQKPDLVVSGINIGPNLGDDVTYSGTVSAALEGTMLGIPSFAISLNCHKQQGTEEERGFHFDTAAHFGRILAENLLQSPMPPQTFLNVNVPDLPFEQLEGICLTRLGKRIYQDRIIRRIDPQGKDYYWIGGEIPSWEPEEGTDFQAIEQNKVSITPISFDLTNHEALASLKGWTEKIEASLGD